LIEMLWSMLLDQVAGFDPVRDTIDITLVALGVYWLLVLIRGTRAVQILVGLLLLIGTSLVSQAFELTTVEWILDNFLSSAVLIIIVLFQADIRRALARVGRGVFPSVASREDTQVVEEVARAAQSLAQPGCGALIVLERETHLSDLIEAGTAIDAAVKRDLLVSLFLPQSPLHDGAVVVQGGRIAQAGCILPLTLREELPEGLGTRHRAAVGITEESDAVVVVVSEETRALSLVVGGVLAHGLDGARLREVLRDVLAGGDAGRAVMAELTGRRDVGAERIGAAATDRV
jgi:diadenylate cyclase